MKIRTRIALLLVALAGVFATGLAAMKAHERAEIRAIAAQREAERRESFAAVRAHWSKPLEVFASDFSVWDDMVNAIAREDRAWVDANLNDAALASYQVQAVWLHRSDGSLLCARNTLYSPDLAAVPLPPEAITRLLPSGRRWHFFARTDAGLLEIRGATVHGSRDSSRQSEPRGFLYVARRWGTADFRELSLMSGNDVSLREEGSPLPPADDVSSVSFVDPLVGWDGAPVAWLAVRNESAVMRHFQTSGAKRFLWVLLCATALLPLLGLALTLWVSRPLCALTHGLRSGRTEAMRGLPAARSEFGDLARLIRDFFDQRAALLHEMRQREQTEQALRASEERMRQGQKMEAIGRLAGGIAHDFNNLLTAILGYAELLQLRLENDEASLHEASQIREAAERAAALTNQLLAFSRKQVLQPRVIDLNGLLLGLEPLLRRVISENVALDFQTSGESVRVRADRHQLEQVVLNLCVNARDAMPQGGRITLRTAIESLAAPNGEATRPLPPGDYAALIVEDTGIGMDEETRVHIFEPFFTTKGVGKGTGLGLATVYGIVEQSGGAISVRSAPGKGTRFTIRLPREHAPLDLTPVRVKARNGPRSETILVVEDDARVREMVCSVLRSQGFRVFGAEGAHEALALARREQRAIDLLVSDVVMPHFPGPRLADHLRAEYPRMRVLFVSGYPDGELAGSLPPEVHFLRKPFSPDVLGEKVREVLDAQAAA